MVTCIQTFDIFTYLCLFCSLILVNIMDIQVIHRFSLLLTALIHDSVPTQENACIKVRKMTVVIHLYDEFKLYFLPFILRLSLLNFSFEFCIFANFLFFFIEDIIVYRNLSRKLDIKNLQLTEIHWTRTLKWSSNFDVLIMILMNMHRKYHLSITYNSHQTVRRLHNG